MHIFSTKSLQKNQKHKHKEEHKNIHNLNHLEMLWFNILILALYIHKHMYICVDRCICVCCVHLHIVVAINFLSMNLGYIQHLLSQIVWMWTFLWSIDVQFLLSFLWNKHWKVSYWLRKGICLLRVITRHVYHLPFTFQKVSVYTPNIRWIQYPSLSVKLVLEL